MKLFQKLVIAVPALVLGPQALAEATFYSRAGFRGEAITLDKRTRNFEDRGDPSAADAVTCGA